MLKLSLIDILIVTGYFVLCLFIGLYRSKQIKTLKQFAAGYKSISGTVLMCIVFASSIGAGSTIGAVEKVYLFGAAFCISQFLKPIGWFISAKIFAPNIEKFKECISISQVMHKLYGSPGRWLTNIASLILAIGVVAAQALAIGYIFHYFFGIEIAHGIYISYVILAVYSALGGIRTIAVTEVFQLAIFLFIIPITYIVILNNTDGLPNLLSKLPQEKWQFEPTRENLLIFFSFAFYAIGPEFDSPFIQRCLLAASPAQLKKSLNQIAFLHIPFSISIFLIAYMVMAYSPEVAPKDALLYYVANYVPDGIRGFMVAGLIAIIMSISEAWLNSTSVVIVNDIIKVQFPRIDERKQVVALRTAVIALAALSATFSLMYGDMLGLIRSASNFFMPFIFIPLSAGFMGLKATPGTFIASTIMAAICIIMGRLLTGEFALLSLAFGMVGSAVGLFGYHYKHILPQLTLKDIMTIMRRRKLLNSPLLLLGKTGEYIITLPQKGMAACKELPRQKAKYYSFPIFTLLYYFLYVLHISDGPGHALLSYLIIVGYTLCFILLFKEVVFDATFLKKYLNQYWYVALTFCLPTVSSYMLLISQGDDFWIINGLLSAFSLYFFVNAMEFVIMLSIGTMAGFLFFSFSGVELGLYNLQKSIGSIGYVYTFLLFTALVFVKSREKEQEEKFETMKMLGGAIAHEVQSPMATMSMGANAMSEVLSDALKTAKPSGKGYTTLRLEDDAHELLLMINETLQKTGKQGVHVIKSTLAALRNTSNMDEKQIHNISVCLPQAIANYVEYNDKAKNVELDIKADFKVFCSEFHIDHITSNLLKNAYKHGGSNVRVKVWAKGNKVHFKDYGRGIRKEDLPYIFDRFFTKSRSGTGIGLSFCKTLMEELGGTISCKSSLGKYTKFTLTFPELPEA